MKQIIDYSSALYRHIKSFFCKGYVYWIVVERTYFNAEKGKWLTENIFYFGNDVEKLFTKDWKNDWRFKAVEGKRLEAKLLGVCRSKYQGQVKYPLMLTNGDVIYQSNSLTDWKLKE